MRIPGLGNAADNPKHATPGDDPEHHPRARDGRAPNVMRIGEWVPMRQHRDEEEVDFAIVGTLACRLAEGGVSVVAFDAGPYFRPLEDFASD